MASLYIDKQTRNWKLKTKKNGKDARITLRKALDAENNDSKPADVILLAAQHDASFAPQPAKADSQDTAPQPNPQSLHEFIRWFKIEYPKTHAAGSSKKMDRTLRYLKDFLGADRPVNQVHPDDIRKFAQFRMAAPAPSSRKKGKAPSGQTMVSELIYVSALFKQAIERDIIVKNPVAKPLKEYINAFPANKEGVKYLTSDQVAAFLQKVDEFVQAGNLEQIYADLFRVMLATGMRVTAACELRWEWIDAEGKILIPPSTPAIPTKTKTGYKASVSGFGKDVLDRRKKEQGGQGRVFPGLKQADVWYRLKNKFGITPHQLRHSVGTNMVDLGERIEVIADCLGHRDLATTKIYARIRDSVTQAAIDRLPWK